MSKYKPGDVIYTWGHNTFGGDGVMELEIVQTGGVYWPKLWVDDGDYADFLIEEKDVCDSGEKAALKKLEQVMYRLNEILDDEVDIALEYIENEELRSALTSYTAGLESTINNFLSAVEATKEDNS
jgi:hypothetical protein